MFLLLIGIGIAFYFYSKNKSTVDAFIVPLVEKLKERKKLLLIIFIPIDLVLLANLKNTAMGIMVFALNLAVACFFSSRLRVVTQKFIDKVFAKDNKTAVAIAIGSAAIVFAILLGNISQNNQPASNGAPQMLRGVPRWHELLKQNVYDCPAGYGPKGGVTFGGSGTDPWCYKKN